MGGLKTYKAVGHLYSQSQECSMGVDWILTPCIFGTQDVKPGEHMVCQQYVSKPFLIDGFKFDLRVYVLVTSCDPLRIFVYEDGLGRFATMKYLDPSANNLVSTL